MVEQRQSDVTAEWSVNNARPTRPCWMEGSWNRLLCRRSKIGLPRIGSAAENTGSQMKTYSAQLMVSPYIPRQHIARRVSLYTKPDIDSETSPPFRTTRVYRNGKHPFSRFIYI